MDPRTVISEHRDLLVTHLSPPASEFLHVLLQDQEIEYKTITHHGDMQTTIAKIDDLINIVCKRSTTDFADRFLSWLLDTGQDDLHKAILGGLITLPPAPPNGDYFLDRVDDGGESSCESLSEKTTPILDIRRVLPTNDFVNEKLADASAVYPITSPVRGVAMLVINSKFPSKKEFNRNGSEYDTNNLSRLFTWLGYEVLVYSNITKRDLDLKLATLVQDKKQRTYSSFVLCILSYGGNGTIVMSDLSQVYTDELLDRLDSNNFPAMAGKPKLIYIDANNKSLSTDAGFALPKPGEGHNMARTGPLQSIQIIKSRTVPSETSIQRLESSNPNIDESNAKVACKADFALLLASFPGYTALHNISIGSICTRVLIETFYKHAHNHHLVELAMKIRRKKCSRFLRQTTEVVTLTDTLTKDFYLFPEPSQ